MFGIRDPNWLLQPWRSVGQFAENLYAYLKASKSAPIEHEGPVTIRVPEGQTALRIAVDRDRPAVSSPRGGGKSAAPVGVDLNPPRPGGRRRDDGGASAKFEAPIVQIDGSVEFTGAKPVRFERPPQVWDERKHTWITPPAWEWPDTGSLSIPGGGSTQSNNVLVGKVTGGSGDTWEMTLYPNGLDGDGSFSADVNILQIDPDEDAPVGDIFTGIIQFEDSDGNKFYDFQPPVWRDSGTS